MFYIVFELHRIVQCPYLRNQMLDGDEIWIKCDILNEQVIYI